MNRVMILEAGIAAVITNVARLADIPRIRTWQAIDADARWTPANDRVLPVIDIRCGAPSFDDTGITHAFPVVVRLYTKADDDADHRQIATLYEAVQDVLDALYSDLLHGTDRTADEKDIAAGVALNEFNAELSKHDTEGRLHVGGMEWEASAPPIDDDSLNAIELVFQIHCSRQSI